MAYFDSLINCRFLICDHEEKLSEVTETTFLIDSGGSLCSLIWDKRSPIGTKDRMFVRLLSRGDLYSVYNGLRDYALVKMPLIQGNIDEEHNYEVYAIDEAGRSLFVDPESGDPKPIYVSSGRWFYLEGADVRRILYRDAPSQEKTFLGKDFLERFFDVEIPEGYESLAIGILSELFNKSDDNRLKRSAAKFVHWLLHGNGLPPFSARFRDELLSWAEEFRNAVNQATSSLDKTSALLRGCDCLRGFGENALVWPILEKLAQQNVPLACGLLCQYAFEDRNPEEALKYAVKGSSLGDKNCCYIGSILLEKGDVLPMAKAFLEMGMEAGDARCFERMAVLTMDYRNVKEGHPFYCPNPVTQAVVFAKEAANLHLPSAMVFLARILLTIKAGGSSEYAYQLLKRAEALGEHRAYFFLSVYYVEEGAGQNLDLAEAYLAKAIKLNEEPSENYEILRSDILFAKGEDKEAIAILEKLAKEGNSYSMTFLGKRAVGADPTCPDVEDPIPAPYLKCIANPDAFYQAALWRTHPDIVSPKKAAKTLGKLARDGEVLALWELGKIFRDGPEKMRDLEKSSKLFNAFLKIWQRFSADCGKEK